MKRGLTGGFEHCDPLGGGGFEGLDQPGQQPVDGCGNTGLQSLGNDGAVNGIDLCGPTAENVLEHGGAVVAGLVTDLLDPLLLDGAIYFDLQGLGDIQGFVYGIMHEAQTFWRLDQGSVGHP